MITKEIVKLLSEQKLGFVATVSPNGAPNLSPKGTIISLDKNTLALLTFVLLRQLEICKVIRQLKSML